MIRPFSTLPRLALTVVVVAAAALVAPARPAAAQIAGVLARPRLPRRDSAAVSPDSATRAGRTSAKTPEVERQRLDIQAWVDSAAGALARSGPPPIPPTGSGSIFNAPAVPDSLRPPPPPPVRARPGRPARATRRPARP